MNKLKVIESKILNHDQFMQQTTLWRFKNQKVVFTNGCFDILHRGHIEYLAKASALGDVLVVGLNTDESIKKIKGISRPVQDERSRALIMASLHFVDFVALFNEETPSQLISRLKPDILVKGKDYKIKEVVGYDIVTKYGGEVKTIDYLKGYSTSAIIERFRH